MMTTRRRVPSLADSRLSSPPPVGYGYGSRLQTSDAGCSRASVVGRAFRATSVGRLLTSKSDGQSRTITYRTRPYRTGIAVYFTVPYSIQYIFTVPYHTAKGGHNDHSSSLVVLLYLDHLSLSPYDVASTPGIHRQKDACRFSRTLLLL